jgi:hypothetical protein
VVTTKERSFIEQHQSGGNDLAERAEQKPGPERWRRPRHGVTGGNQHANEKQDGERKTKQEADVGRTPGAERSGQLPLHGIARDLAHRGGDREGNPERGNGEHQGDCGKRKMESGENQIMPSAITM